ncbi:MAG: AAA family ATPase [Acidimicrobiia bacterium]|nr:AAA family ATPase [Acidimicrobiia bacterium]
MSLSQEEDEAYTSSRALVGRASKGAVVNRADLRLVVENLGPIRRADVALRPLTVLIGRNNTGKTYLAQALYAVHKAIDSFPHSKPEKLTDSEYEALMEALVPHMASEDSDPLEVRNLTDELKAKVTGWVHGALKDTGQALNQRLFAYFGVSDLVDITRWGANDLVMKVLQQDGTLLFDSKGNASVDRSAVLSVTIDEEDGLGFPPFARLLPRNGDDHDNEFLRQQLSWMLASNVWQGYARQVQLGGLAHYLPAGRSGLLHAWTDVVKLRLQLERDRFGLVRPDSDLGGVALDFISSLADVLGPHQRYRRRPQLSLFHEDESLALLQELMDGKIRAGSETDMVPTLEYEQDGHQLPIRRASSMVADLAPLAMWIDRLIQPGDLLIIDEPESHLHPEAIRLVARVLVRLVNENVRVVCATHSSILLHELSNCILRSQLSNPDERSSDKFAEGDVLALDDIVVHRFHRPDPTDPVEVEQIEIDPDWGIPEDEYVAVASDLADETAQLISALA